MAAPAIPPSAPFRLTQPVADAATAAGVVFADGVARGAADQTSARLGNWHRKVTEEITNTNILIVGDSTGAETVPARWPRLLGPLVAAQYPRQTVIYRPWDDATKTYPAGSAVTIQTGTGPTTITIYNASVSGQVIGYVLTNQNAITAGITDLDVMIWNYGHNSPQDLDNYRAITHQAFQLFNGVFYNIAMVMTAQNPRATITTGNTTAADYAPDQLRQRANFEYAAAECLPCVDVNAAFRAYGGYNADLLVDGLHPSAAGSALWANLTWSTIKPKANRVSFAPPVSRPNHVWVSAKAFDPVVGSPVYGVTLGVGGWSLDPDTEQAVSAIVDYPSDWKLFSVDAFYVTATAPDAANRTVVVRPSFMYIGGGTAGTVASTVIGNWTDASNSNAVLNSTASTTTIQNLYNRQGGGKKPVAFKITRRAADAADTLAQPLVFLGLMIHRMF